MGSLNVLQEDYTKKIKRIFLKDFNLQKLIYYNVSDPLSQPNLLNPNILFNGENVVENSQTVFNPPKVLFVPKNSSTITKESTFLMIRFLPIPVYKSVATSEVSIIITIACHNNLVGLKNGTNRMIAISDIIDEYLNGNTTLGLGRISSPTLKEVQINNDFLGLNLIYTVSEFSMNYRNDKVL